jgi:hypothetical protein
MRGGHGGKREHMLVKDHVPRNINSIRGNMKAFVTLVYRTIAKKDTLFRAKIELVIVVWS